MTRRDFVTLNLDLKQMGVGGVNSWGAIPTEAARINARRGFQQQRQHRARHTTAAPPDV
jgi:hypothetical protein